MALLIGYGAAAVNPYLALDSIDDMISEGLLEGVSPRQARRNYIKAACKGVLKVMSKMGISTVASYTGAQVFEAIGLDGALIDEYFTGTVEPHRRRRALACSPPRWPPGTGGPTSRGRPSGPTASSRWAGSTSGAARASSTSSTRRRSSSSSTPRGRSATRSSRSTPPPSTTSPSSWAPCAACCGCKPAPGGPVPLEEVEPIATIMTRFSTGAMSYGSISAEAHETLAIAMNRHRRALQHRRGRRGRRPLHARRQRGPAAQRHQAGGLGPLRGDRASTWSTRTTSRSRSPRAPSPARAASSPGNKVYPWIARTRYSTPGVGLISPPPHHDIYSIEDIAQLIHDLKSSNPAARVHVKLVAEVGVGTVAAGVAKAHSDVVLISGHDGGTGAAPLTSLKHAGIPWEIGLAETQQTLLVNGLRDRIVVQVDGQLKTGRDVVDRRAARRRGVRLRHGAARRLGLHHDARLPPRHLPGRHRHPEPGAAGQVQRQARVRRDLLRVHRRGGARAPGLARACARWTRRSAGSTCSTPTAAVDHWKAAGLDLSDGAGPARRARRHGAAPDAAAGPRAREGPRPRVPRRSAQPALDGRRRRCRWSCRSPTSTARSGTLLGLRDQPALRRRPGCPTTRSR